MNSTKNSPASLASKPCATCTGCCSCSTSRPAPSSATPQLTPRRTGRAYSLEHLRDLELVRLTGGESLDGYYIHESIQMLFRLIREGFEGPESNLLADGIHNTFEIRALDSAPVPPGRDTSAGLGEAVQRDAAKGDPADVPSPGLRRAGIAAAAASLTPNSGSTSLAPCTRRSCPTAAASRKRTSTK